MGVGVCWSVFVIVSLGACVCVCVCLCVCVCVCLCVCVSVCVCVCFLPLLAPAFVLFRLRVFVYVMPGNLCHNDVSVSGFVPFGLLGIECSGTVLAGNLFSCMPRAAP